MTDPMPKSPAPAKTPSQFERQSKRRLNHALMMLEEGTVAGLIQARDIVLREQKRRVSACKPEALKQLLEVMMRYPEEPVVSIATPQGWVMD